MIKEKYIIEGMSCTACSSSVERVTRKLNGVTESNVNLILKTLFIEYDESVLKEEDIFNAVKNAGFDIHKEINNKVVLEEIKEDNKKYPSVKTRLIVSFCFLVPLMYISMGSMIGLPIFSFLSKETNPLIFSLVELILATPVLIVNRKFFVNGYKGLVRKSPNMDTLISFGSLISYIYGIFSIFMIAFFKEDVANKYVNNLYFDSSAMILALITIGKALEEKAKMKTSDAIDSLNKLIPNKVLIDNNGEQKEISIDDLSINDKIIIKAGEIIPVDGIIYSGSAYIDESRITGESLPMFKKNNDSVVSGSINTDGYLIIEVKSVKNDTTLNKIIDLLRKSGSSKTNIERIADKISAYFVPCIMGISLVTFIAWLIINKEFEPALYHAIQVLVISCPCALGLATPVAVTASIGACSKEGILIKKSDVFEDINKLTDFVFDKTGTLTVGVPKVNDIVVLKEKELLLKISKSLELKSNHPIAKAILEYTNDIDILDIKNLKIVPGEGVVGLFNGKEVLIGNKKMIDEKHIESIKDDNIYTSIYVSYDNDLLGIIHIVDKVKEESKDVISYLKNNNIYVSMLSGDSFKVCNKVKEELNIDIAYDSVLPIKKAEIIKEITNSGRVVAFIGDGINDSVALTNASVGISINDATDVAIDSAKVVLLKNNLKDIIKLHSVSVRTVKIIKENLLWALVYNLLMIPIAAGVYSFINININPMLASLSMSISSLVVVLNSLRLRKIKEKNNGNNKC